MQYRIFKRTQTFLIYHEEQVMLYKTFLQNAFVFSFAKELLKKKSLPSAVLAFCSSSVNTKIEP